MADGHRTWPAVKVGCIPPSRPRCCALAPQAPAGARPGLGAYSRAARSSGASWRPPGAGEGDQAGATGRSVLREELIERDRGRQGCRACSKNSRHDVPRVIEQQSADHHQHPKSRCPHRGRNGKAEKSPSHGRSLPGCRGFDGVEQLAIAKFHAGPNPRWSRPRRR